MPENNVDPDIEVIDLSQANHESISWVCSLDNMGLGHQRLDTIKQVLREHEEFRNVKVYLYAENGKFRSWFHDVKFHDPQESLSINLSAVVHETIIRGIFPNTLKEYHAITRRKVMIGNELFSLIPAYSSRNMWNDIGVNDYKFLGLWVVWGEDNPRILPIISRLLDTVMLGLDGSSVRPLLGMVVHDELREDAYRRSDDYEWN